MISDRWRRGSARDYAYAIGWIGVPYGGGRTLLIPEQRVITLTEPDGGTTGFAYAGLRGLAGTTTTVTDARGASSTYTLNIWGGQNIRRETNVTGNPLASYEWSGGRVLRSKQGSNVAYAQHDALRSPTRWTGTDGGDQGRTRYGAWGTTENQQGSVPPIGYTGHYQDAESGDYYAQQRYYRPGIGRFTRVDPWVGDVLNPVTLNKYLAFNANPLIYIDPDGRIALLADRAEDIDAFSQGSLAMAKDFAGAMGDSPWYAKPGLALGWAAGGIGYVGGNAVNGIRGMSNAAANAIVVAGDAALSTVTTDNVFSPLAGEARTEVETFVEGAAPVVDAFRNDWRGSSRAAITTAATGIATTFRNAMAGESQAIFDIASYVDLRKSATRMGESVHHAVEPPKVGAPTTYIVAEAADARSAVVANTLPTDVASSARRLYLNQKFERTGNIDLDINIRARQQIARGFYEDAGFSGKRLESHLRGIDYSQDVGFHTLSRGRLVEQWQPPSSPVGNYFTPVGSDPFRLGMDAFGRERFMYAPVQRISVLRSTAADIPSWKEAGVIYRGGGVQYFTGNPDIFKPVKGGP